MRYTYTVMLVLGDEGGYVVEVPALPGCVTSRKTLTEALLMAEDAIAGYLAVLQEDSDDIPREGENVTLRLGARREASLRTVAARFAPTPALPARGEGVLVPPRAGGLRGV